MKIFDEAKDQCLLCVGFDFDLDAPFYREFVERKFQPGIRQKQYWRYHHIYLGLRTLVAYGGRHPVGHVEFIPIEYAPRPVAGRQLMMIDCLHVAPHAHGKGVGKALLEAAETEAKTSHLGMAVLAHRDLPFMPAPFFAHHGYRSASERSALLLMYKPFGEVEEPRFLPVQPCSKPSDKPLAIDYFHCPQCPFSTQTLTWLNKATAKRAEQIELQVFETSDRAAVERWGLWCGVSVNGQTQELFPPSASHIALQMTKALSRITTQDDLLSACVL